MDVSHQRRWPCICVCLESVNSAICGWSHSAWHSLSARCWKLCLRLCLFGSQWMLWCIVSERHNAIRPPVWRVHKNHRDREWRKIVHYSSVSWCHLIDGPIDGHRARWKRRWSSFGWMPCRSRCWCAKSDVFRTKVIFQFVNFIHSRMVLIRQVHLPFGKRLELHFPQCDCPVSIHPSSQPFRGR